MTLYVVSKSAALRALLGLRRGGPARAAPAGGAAREGHRGVGVRPGVRRGRRAPGGPGRGSTVERSGMGCSS